LADLSLFSFLKTIAKINKFSHILEYRKDETLCKRLGGEYKVRMGFGLHLGWAIEGTIGSVYKIDASYLSPNVNIAARLEAATK
jgi:class 3 adenylate cyclase